MPNRGAPVTPGAMSAPIQVFLVPGFFGFDLADFKTVWAEIARFILESEAEQ
jgi:hypothetical protein